MKFKDDLSVDELKSVLNYDGCTGIFTRKNNTMGAKSGDIAGARSKRDYVTIRVNGGRYYAHRLAWLYTNNTWPPEGMVVDHINGICNDNRIENLRLLPFHENVKIHHKPMGATKHIGASYKKSMRKYITAITINGKTKYLGAYDTPEEASKVYLDAREKAGRI